MSANRAVSSVVERLVYTSFHTFFVISALCAVDHRKTVLRWVKWPGKRTKPRYLKLPHKKAAVSHGVTMEYPTEPERIRLAVPQSLVQGR